MDRFLDPLLARYGELTPDVLGAIVVLVVGLVVSWLVAWAALAVLRRSEIGARIARAVRGTDEVASPIDGARWLSRGIFWFLVLVTLAGFFQALGFRPITDPLTRFFELTIAYLPRLVAAFALGVVAWIVGGFVRLAVRRGLDGLKVDERLTPMARRTPDTPKVVSRAVSEGGYWLTWLLFLPAILQALAMDGILSPVQRMVDKILAFLPNVLTAALIIVAAYFVGRVVAGFVTSALMAIGLDRAAERLGIGKVAAAAGGQLGTAPPRIVLSRVLGILVMTVIVLFAAMEALDVIAFAQLSGMLEDVITIGGRVLLGLVIFAAGWALANGAGRMVKNALGDNSRFVALATRVAILVLAGAIALRQMGFANEIISLAFGLMIGGISAAVAIAFGVGGREVAGRELERWIERTRAARVHEEQGAAVSAH